MTFPIRIGIIGIGDSAKRRHLPALNLLPEYKLSAIYSKRRDAAKIAAAEYGITSVVKTLDELVSHPEVDLVVVLTTVAQHVENIRAAIGARKDVYSEWPLTPSTGLSEELAGSADTAGIRSMVGLHRRFAPHNRYLADLLKKGYVGKLRSVRMHVSRNLFQSLLPKGLRWRVPPQKFSSMVAIFAGHYLDMLFSATGWPDNVLALDVTQFPEVTIVETGEVITTTNPDEFVFIGTFPGGAVATAHFGGGKRNGSGVQIDFKGTEGDIRISNSSAFGGGGDDYVMTGAHGDKLPLTPLPVPAKYDCLPQSNLPSPVTELAQNYVAIAHDIRTGTRIAPTFNDAVRMHKLIDAAMESTAKGGSVALHHDHH
jgi:predicted dehydrogenase